MSSAPSRPADLEALIAAREEACARACGRSRPLGHPRRRRLARGLQGVRHQEDELPLLGRAPRQARQGRRAAARREHARRHLQRGVAHARLLLRRRRSRQASRRRSPSASRGRATPSSTWARSRARTRTTRRRRARSSTPSTPRTCSAGAGTGARMLMRRTGTSRRCRDSGRSSPSRRTAGATSTPAAPILTELIAGFAGRASSRGGDPPTPAAPDGGS